MRGGFLSYLSVDMTVLSCKKKSVTIIRGGEMVCGISHDFGEGRCAVRNLLRGERYSSQARPSLANKATDATGPQLPAA